MALTKTGKAAAKGLSVLIGVGVLGALAGSEYQNTKAIDHLSHTPKAVVTQIVIATPTIEPTATPSARLRPVTKIVPSHAVTK